MTLRMRGFAMEKGPWLPMVSFSYNGDSGTSSSAIATRRCYKEGVKLPKITLVAHNEKVPSSNLSQIHVMCRHLSMPAMHLSYRDCIEWNSHFNENYHTLRLLGSSLLPHFLIWAP